MATVIEAATETAALKEIVTHNFSLRSYGEFNPFFEADFQPLKFGPIVSLIDITPTLAAIMLKFNTGNRPVKQNNLERIIAEMKAGRFVFNGDAIRFSSDQRLIDGQHRLMACVETGLTFTSVVIEGIDQKAFSTIDSGRKREAGDVLAISGFSNSKVMAAAIRLVVFINSGNKTIQSISMTGAEVLELSKTMLPGIVESTHYAAGKKNTPLTRSSIAALHYLFSQKDPVKAATFFEKLRTGENLSGRHPILLLRNALEYGHKSKRSLAIESEIALTIKAWNHFRRGNEIKSLRYRDDEAFPRIDDTEDGVFAELESGAA